MNIPIKSHTKVRRPESKYRIAIWGNGHSSQTIHNVGLVTDISRLENPLFTGAYEYAKPSLLTRVKERFKK